MGLALQLNGPHGGQGLLDQVDRSRSGRHRRPGLAFPDTISLSTDLDEADLKAAL